MTKNRQVINEAIRTKHPFPKEQSLPTKPQKHRYERRKVRGILQTGDWLTSENGLV